MEAPISPREASPAVALLAVPAHPVNRKRKHAAISGGAADSPAPSDRADTPNPNTENVVLHKLDLSSRPRLTISRHPGFIPIAPGSPYHTTEPLCTNRLNFRYTPAGVTGDEGGIHFRTIESAPTTFRVSWEDRSPFIKVTQDGLGLRGDKGFRSARCNAPVREGKWYMEVKIGMGGGDRTLESKHASGSHVRLGWARREAPLNGPAGLDGYSYGMRDKSGEKVHLSRPKMYGQAFKSGDVVGMYISLPEPKRQPKKNDPYDPAHVKRERIAIEFKGQEYFESLEYAQSKEMLALMTESDRKKAPGSTPAPSSSKKSATVKNLPSTSRGGKSGPPEPAPMRPLPTLGPESCIAFFVNGKSQGIAFQDLFDYLPLRTPPNKHNEKRRTNREGIREHRENFFDDGSLGYYPMISLFNEAEVQLNPGPDFEYPPPPDVDALLMADNPDEADIKPNLDDTRRWRPLCERYPEYMEEQFALDKLEEVDLVKQVKQAKEAETKGSSEESKREIHRAKRRAQAAARKERKRKEQEQSAAPSASARSSVPPQQKPSVETSRAASPDVEMLAPLSASGLPTLEGFPLGTETPDPDDGGGLRPYSPIHAVGSVSDVQAYFTEVVQDASEYNTEYEDLPDDRSSHAGDSMAIDDEIARLA
ncbi:Set1 complex component ash2 [Phanerochaete sordida]|uniref:Set1 complex component ash2 n=1 Tax=Phanerochaete sordida TaxID=48140 RepID=A0A9P3GRL7_9APHY|nr:Set1 complex component ash2 [Phanerochaete sordida]